MRFPASRLLSIAVLSVGGLCGFARPVTAETISVVGTLTSEGAECPAMKGDDGKLYSLTSSDTIGLAVAGTRVKIEGTVAEMSICQQGITIEVTKVEPAE